MRKMVCFWIVAASFITFSPINLMGQEICDNAIDDDGDGLIDLLDDECICTGLVSNSSVVSMFPNPSFEEYTNCPLGWNSDNYVVDWWSDFTEPTSDYLNYCDWTWPLDASSPLYNFPDGDGVMGTLIFEGYNEYIGTELIVPLNAGVEYTIELYVGAISISNEAPPVVTDSLPFIAPYLDIALWGSASTQPPYNGASENIFGCIEGVEGWEQITTVYYVPEEEWHLINLTFTPTKTYNSLIIGAPCYLDPAYPDFPVNPPLRQIPYFVWDGFRLNESSEFHSRIEQEGGLCTEDLILTASIDTLASIDYQWYLNGIALIGENGPTLDANLYGEGLYSVVFTVNGECESRSLEIIGSSTASPPDFSIVSQTLCSGVASSLYTTGNADYYSWMPNGFLTINNNGSSVSATLDTSLWVTVTGYLDGCAADTSFWLDVVQTPVLNLIPRDTMCIGESYELVFDMTNIDSVSWHYYNYPSDLNYIQQINDSTYLLSHPHNYTHVITAYNGPCTYTDTLYLIANNLLPIANGNILEDLSFDNLSIDIENLTTNYSTNTYYIWDFGNGDTLVTTSEENVTASYNVPGTYIVCLEALQTNIHEYGSTTVICSTSWCDTIAVLDGNDYSVDFPNVFTPNHDNVNDFYGPLLKNIESIDVSILDRWGLQVAHLDESNLYWDGFT